jgi:hypothetical protein
MRTSAVLFLKILSTQRREVRVHHCTIVLRIDCSGESNRSTIKILFQMIASTAKLRIWLFSRRPDRDS